METDDWGGVLAENAPPKAVAKPVTDDWGGIEAPAAPAPRPAVDDWGGVQAPQSKEHIQMLVANPEFEPAAYAVETGDEDTAFEARELRRNRSFGEKAGEFGKTLLQPQTYVNAARSAAAFAGGLVATPLHTIAQAGATAGAPIARAVGAGDLANTLENEQQTQGSEALQSAQQIEESLRSLGRGARGLVSGDERARFRDEIAAYRNQLALGEQRPLDTGVVAAASRMLTGNDPSAAFSPEALAAQGARPASPLMIELGAASADPTNLMIPVAGKVLPKVLAGGITQAAGKALQAPAAAIAYIPKVAHLNKVMKTGSAIGAGVAAYEAIQHPEQAAQIAGVIALGKTLGWLGKGLDAQGLAYRTGIPSPLDIAKAAGRGTMSGNTQRLIGNTAVNAALGVAALEPVDYLQAEGDPRLMAEALIGNAGMGAMFGLPGETFANRQQMQAIQAYRFAQHGAQQLSQNAAYPAHNAVMATMRPEYRDQINRLRAYLHAGTGTDVLVLDGHSYAQQVGAIGQNTRGNFAAADGVIYLNADSISADPLQTGRHEAGHAIVNFLQNAGRDGEASGLFDAIKAGMTPEQLTTLTSSYRSALSKGTKVAAEQSGLGWEKGEDAAARARVDTAIAEANPEAKILEENLSEIVRDILDGRGIESFSLSKPVTERLADAVSGWMEGRGWLPDRWSSKIDKKAKLGFQAQAVKEAARQAKTLLYETGQRASAAIADGPTAEQEMIRIQREIDAIPPFNPQGNAQTEQANAQQRQRLQRELSQWERRGAGIPVPEDAAPPSPDGTPAPAPAADPITTAAEQLRAEGNRTPYPAVRQAMQRNPAATTAEQIVDTVRKLAEEREATTGAIDDLTNQKIMTRSDAKKAIEIAIAQHGEPITSRDNLVTAAIRVNAKGSIAKGEFNRPSTPEARVGAGFNGPEDAAGVRQRFTIVGTAQRPPQAGDHVQIYAPKGQPDIYRVAKVDKDGMLLVVGTLTADEKTTFPVKPGTFTLLETTSAPQAPAATPPSPAPESNPPTPAPAQAATPAPAAGETSPQSQETPSGTPQGASAAISGLDPTPGAGTPDVPELRIVPNPKGGGFIIVNRADEKIGRSNPYPSEVAAKAAIRMMGSREPIKLAKGPGGVDDVLNHIAKMGGFAAKKGTQEYDDMATKLMGYTGLLGGTETPADIANWLHDQYNIGDGSVRLMWPAVDAAIRARKRTIEQSDAQAARDKAAEQAGKDKAAKLSADLQEKLSRPGGAEMTPDEIAQVQAVFPDFEYQPPEPDVEPLIQSAPEPPPSQPVPPPPNVTTAEPPVPDAAPQPGEISHDEIQKIAAVAKERFLSDKTPAKTGPNKGQHTKENQKAAAKAAFQAVAEAHAATLPANYDGIKLTESPLGFPEVSGTIKPGRPFDDYLLELAGMPEGDPRRDTIQIIQGKIGDTISITYAHAPGRTGDPNYAATRRASQKKNPAKWRLTQGTAQSETKVFKPQKMKFNFGERSVTTLGTNPEKLLANFGWAEEAMAAAGETMPYRSVSDPQLVADLKGLQANHDAGYTWEGEPITGLADKPLATNRPDAEGAPYQGFLDDIGFPDVPRFEFLNLLLGNEGARVGERGETPIQKAKLTLGIQNRGSVSDPVTSEGETNQLRDRLNEAMGPQELLDADGNPTGKTDRWSNTFLEDPLNEALRIDNILDIHPAVERGVSPLHEHAYSGDLDRHLGKLKAVNTEQERIAAASRFMPEEDPPPKGRAKKRIADKPITIYRGESSMSRGGRMYHQDKEFARQFTQSGRDHEIKSIQVKPSEIFRDDPLPYGGDPDQIDASIERAKAKGFTAIYADEGSAGEPSVLIIRRKTHPSQFLPEDPRDRARARQDDRRRAEDQLRRRLGPAYGSLTPREREQEVAALLRRPERGARFMPEDDTVEINGKPVTTGTPITFTFLRNKESATKLHGKPTKESPFDRGFEPSGRYMTVLEGKGPEGKQFETGEVSFQNPIVIPVGEYGETSWKRALSDRFDGKTGKRLSQAILDAGHDGVITTSQDRAGRKYTSEILDLTTFDYGKARYMPEELPGAGKTLDAKHDMQAERFYKGRTNPMIRVGLSDNPKESVERHNAKVEILNKLEDEGMLTDDVMDAVRGWNDVDVEPALWEAGDKRSLSEIERDHEGETEKEEWGTAKPLFEWVKQRHPETSNINIAGYVLPQGEMLSFSHDGRTRDQDHREISWPYGTAGEQRSGTYKMIAMMNAGAMRIDANSGAISIRRPPTGAQERAILKIIDKGGQASIDAEIADDTGYGEKARAAFTIDDATEAEDVIKRIRTFYKTGKEPRTRFMPEDTGKPGESGRREENLAREAEQAGVNLSLETLKRLTRGDQVAMNAVRRRIEEQTGKAARFMPEDARDIVPAIRINGKLTKGQKGDTHQDILNRHMAANPDDVDALMDFDSKANPNLFVGPDGQEISREQLKERFGVRDSQGLRRIQEGQSFMPEIDAYRGSETPEDHPKLGDFGAVFAAADIETARQYGKHIGKYKVDDSTLLDTSDDKARRLAAAFIGEPIPKEEWDEQFPDFYMFPTKEFAAFLAADGYTGFKTGKDIAVFDPKSLRRFMPEKRKTPQERAKERLTRRYDPTEDETSRTVNLDAARAALSDSNPKDERVEITDRRGKLVGTALERAELDDLLATMPNPDEAKFTVVATKPVVQENATRQRERQHSVQIGDARMTPGAQSDRLKGTAANLGATTPEAMPATGNESLADVMAIHAKPLAQLAVSDPAIIKRLGEGDVVARRDVLPMVRGLLQNLQVAKTVVGLVPVEMMDVLTGSKAATKSLLHDPAMLVNLLPSDADNAIPASVQAIDKLAAVLTRAAAKVASGSGDVTASKFLAALRTGESEHAGKIPQPSERSKEQHPIQMENGRMTDGPRLLFLPESLHHGTPHEFEKFSSEKIGTGEGAQVFGHGIYFAQNKEVAENYKRTLTKGSLRLDGKAWTDAGLSRKGEEYLGWISAHANDGLSLNDAIKQARTHFPTSERPDFDKAIAAIRDRMKVVNEGNLYTVRVKPDHDAFLDWDKPLSAQSEKVKAAILEKWPDMPETMSVERILSHWASSPSGGFGKGRTLKDDQRLASEGLASLGIAGIRYKDQGSRLSIKPPATQAKGHQWEVVDGAGALKAREPSEEAARAAMENMQTSNYVIFNDADIEITHRNGEPVTPAERREAMQNQAPGEQRFMPESAPETRQRVKQHTVEVAMREIEQDMKDGTIPGTAASFAELQDHTDANLYVNDAEREDRRIGPLGKALGWKTQDFADFTNEVIAEIDKRLAARQQRPDPRSAARLRLAARTKPQAQKRELATAD